MRLRELVQRLQEQVPGINRQGNRTYKVSQPSERYAIDFDDDFVKLGWEPFDTDQDAWYFGIWVNPKTYQVLDYTEGDWLLVECGSPRQYNREIRGLIEDYGEGCIAKTIEPDGTLTEYRQDRSKFFVEE